MPRFVILNLADPGQMGPVTKVKSGLEARVKAAPRTIAIGEDIVPIHDLFEALATVSAGNALGPEMDTVKNDCDSAERIFLCTHGTAKDTEHGFGKASGGTPLGSWQDFGRLMRKLLPRKDKVYKVALVMCYGARTDQYRSTDLDHQGMIPPSLLKTSFAYKLYHHLAGEHGRQIVMTARTGAVGFDQKTGMSSVEQEASIDIGLDKEEFLRSPKIDHAMQKWKNYKTAINSEKKADEFTKVDQKYRAKPDAFANPFSDIQNAGKAYHQAVAQKNKLEQRKSAYADLSKYGKIVYSAGRGGLKVVNKYGNGGTIGPATVLYEGAFL